MDNNNEMSEQGRTVLAYLCQDGWLLLEGRYWDALYKLLPTAPDGSRAPPPIILAGAQMATNRQRFDRLVDHIEWADKHDRIKQVGNYLLTLDPTCYERVSTLPDA